VPHCLGLTRTPAQIAIRSSYPSSGPRWRRHDYVAGRGVEYPRYGVALPQKVSSTTSFPDTRVAVPFLGGLFSFWTPNVKLTVPWHKGSAEPMIILICLGKCTQFVGTKKSPEQSPISTLQCYGVSAEEKLIGSGTVTFNNPAKNISHITFFDPPVARSRTAAQLAISRPTLYELMDKLGIGRADTAARSSTQAQKGTAPDPQKT